MPLCLEAVVTATVMDQTMLTRTTVMGDTTATVSVVVTATPCTQGKRLRPSPAATLPGSMSSPMRAATDPGGLRICSGGASSGLEAFPLPPSPRLNLQARMVWVSALSGLR